MAEINISSNNSGKNLRIRPQKLSTRVDLTAMVDLGFLLITFFMLTTTLQKNRSMSLNMPAKTVDGTAIPSSRSLTVVLGEKDSLFYWNGMIDETTKPILTNYSTIGIRQVLLNNLTRIKQETPDKDLIVLIKPTEKANYKNVVDILDEMAITKVKTYAIVEPTAAELAHTNKK
jgi:biopolymer transport protein ExbD